MKVKKWRPLERGDIVDLVAPAWACSKEELSAAIDFLKDQGFVPRCSPNIFQPRLLFSNEHSERLHQLKKAILAKDSRAIWCVRGGYGSVRLLPQLQRLKPQTEAKLFIGMSDITSLHLFLNQEWGWPTIHGPLMDRVGARKLTKAHERELFKLVKGELTDIGFKGLKALNESAKKISTIQAPIVGGNLTVLQGSMGTPFELNTKGKILFIEDTGERGYRIDRIFEQFRQAGLFNGLKAILIGDFMGGNERDGKNLIKDVFKEWASELKIPLIAGLPCGHGEIQRPLPLGTKAILNCGPRPSLVVSTGAKV